MILGRHSSRPAERTDLGNPCAAGRRDYGKLREGANGDMREQGLLKEVRNDFWGLPPTGTLHLQRVRG